MTLLSIFLASILGSLHCVGMCGGFVALYTSRSPSSTKSYARHFAYHFGRLLTYLILASSAYAVGRSIDNIGFLVGVQRLAAGFVAALIFFWVFARLTNKASYSFATGVQKTLAKAILMPIRAKSGDLLIRAPVVGAFILGFGSTFLPCGWLYGFLILCSAAGSYLEACTIIAVFWIGTVPALAIWTKGVTALTLSHGRLLYHLTTFLVLLTAIFSLGSHLGWWPLVFSHHHHH